VGHASATTYPGLVVLFSPAYRQLRPAYLLDRAQVVIGRDDSCEIELDDSAASRRHARVSNRDGVFTIVDLGSRNGTLLDGEPLGEAVLEPLHEVRIGDTFFKFVDRDAEQHARYRIDGAIDGVPQSEPRALVGGYAARCHDAELARVAPTSLSCVVLGETGTGKEVFARELHRLSGRAGSFQAINCAAIPRDLFESELFGHRKGAYSGAHKDRVGLVAAADGGTLFLDEVGDMPLEAQAKLLRVLQTHEVLPLGAVRPERVDLRVVCATHRDLYGLVQKGTFRGDLFARLSEHVTVLTPLRERKEDLFALTLAFLARHSPRRLEPGFAFMAALVQYDWPFNVRELESAIKRAAVLAEGGVLEPRHLPAAVLEASARSRPREARTSAAPEAPARPDVESPPPPPMGDAPAADGFLRGAPTEAKMRELLQRHAGNVAAMARELGKARMQVHRWLRRYHLSLDDYR
jgi:transcriptional regulator with GAF, ATPase, and Fis domain